MRVMGIAQGAVLFAVLSGCATGLDGRESVSGGGDPIARFLPAPPGPDWSRTTPRTRAADRTRFGGGTATGALYRNGAESCTVTITGDSPMMRGVSMTFSNPAAAGVSGVSMDKVGDEPVIVTGGGEVQALAGNYLVEVGSGCARDNQFALIAGADLDGLRQWALRDPVTAAKVDSSVHGADLVLWQRAVGGPKNDWAYAMTATRDGGLATAGRTENRSAGREDLYVVRLDAAGERLWEATFGGAETDRGRTIVETRDGGLVVAGATESQGAGAYDVWVLKLDADGTLLWERTFGGPGTDWASAVIETADGGVAVGAYTENGENGSYDFWILKLDASGARIWEVTRGGPALDWINAIAETADRGLVAVGDTESKGAGGADMWAVKVSADGAPVWDRTFGGPGRDFAAAVAATGDGGVVLAGPVESDAATGVDIAVIRLDQGGETLWTRTFGAAGDDWVRSVLETGDRLLALAGYTMSGDGGLYDMWVLLLAADGSLIREATFGGAANEWARAIVELPDGGLALAGDTWSWGAGGSDVWVVRLAPDFAGERAGR